LLNREGILMLCRTFATVRVHSRLFVAHTGMVTDSFHSLADYPQ
jgi:hypothetical protein